MSGRRQESIAWWVLAGIMALVACIYLLDRRRVPEALPVLAPAKPFALTNQFGLLVQNSDLEGYVLVVDVIFSRCPGQCHRMSRQMRALQASSEKGLPVRFVSLTADPEFDTPEVLRRYSERYAADGASWHFLTGSKQEVYRWAQQGLKFSVVENDPSRVRGLEEMFIHSAAFAVVDRSGRLRAMIQSEDPDSEERVLRTVRNLCLEKIK